MVWNAVSYITGGGLSFHDFFSWTPVGMGTVSLHMQCRGVERGGVRGRKPVMDGWGGKGEREEVSTGVTWGAGARGRVLGVGCSGVIDEVRLVGFLGGGGGGFFHGIWGGGGHGMKFRVGFGRDEFGQVGWFLGWLTVLGWDGVLEGVAWDEVHLMRVYWICLLVVSCCVSSCVNSPVDDGVGHSKMPRCVHGGEVEAFSTQQLRGTWLLLAGQVVEVAPEELGSERLF